jgi:hypothetical protein
VVPAEVELDPRQREQLLDDLDQVLRVERLGHVMVRAEAESAVHLGAVGAQDNDAGRAAHPALVQFLEDGDPVELRHHEVEYQKVGLVVGDRLEDLLAVAADGHLVPLLDEVVREKAPDVGVVVDYVDLRHLAPPSRCPSPPASAGGVKSSIGVFGRVLDRGP